MARRRGATAGRSEFLVAYDIDVGARSGRATGSDGRPTHRHLDIDAVIDLLQHGPPELPSIATRLTP